jgi:hypothetical protein
MLTYDQIWQMVEALERCQAVSDEQIRESAVIGALPPEWTATMKSASTPRARVTNMVIRCSEFPDGIKTLLLCVRFQEGPTPAMAEAERIWASFCRQTVTSPPSSPLSRPPDPDTKLAQEFHWDRDAIVKVYVGMIKGDPQFAPWRLLAIQGPAEASLSTLMDRLEFICQEVSNRDVAACPLLHARVRLHRSMASPDSLARQILTTLAKNADERIAELRRGHSPGLPQLEIGYRDMRQEIDQATLTIEQKWRKSKDLAAASSPTGSELAGLFSDCLVKSMGVCTKVLLLDDFEQVEGLESGEWLLDAWLQRHIVNLKGVVTVIAGSSGLDRLERRDSYTCCRKNVPAMDTAHLLEWARQGWGLTEIEESEVAEANTECEGNPAKFLVYLDAWRIRLRKPSPSCVLRIKRGRLA